MYKGINRFNYSIQQMARQYDGADNPYDLLYMPHTTRTIMWRPTKNGTPRWLAGFRCDERYELVLWQEDIDLLNIALGLHIGHQTYTHHEDIWFYPQRYNKKFKNYSGLDSVTCDAGNIGHADIAAYKWLLDLPAEVPTKGVFQQSPFTTFAKRGAS